MKKRIVISILLALIAGSHSIRGETTPATQTAAAREHAVRPPESAPPAAPDTADDHARDLEQLQRSIALLREQDRLLHQQRMFPRQREANAPAPPPWLLPLLIAAVAASLAAAALQPFLTRRTETLLRVMSTAVNDVDAKIDSSVRIVLERFQSGRTDVAERVNGARDATLEQLAVLSTDLGRVREEVARLERDAERNTASGTASAGDPVRLELQVLAEHWKQFREKKELSAACDGANQDNPWENLLTELGTVVPAELRPSFDAVLTPYREHRQLVQKIGIIPHVVKGEMPLSTEAAELKRARDLTQMLIAVQSPDGGSRLQFRFQSWVTDTFLPFADLYLQSYQKARLERCDGELLEGMALVRQVLRIASLEPVDVTLGETRFDSTRHIGRFTSSDPRFSDGVITGVVRNGFIESGQQVIRQPEVIVNRVR